MAHPNAAGDFRLFQFENTQIAGFAAGAQCYRPHLFTRQYARLVHRWFDKRRFENNLLWYPFDAADEGHSNLSQDANARAVQFLLGHIRLETTFRYLGIEVDDTLHTAEQIELLIVGSHLSPVVTRRSLAIDRYPDAWPPF